MWLLPCSADGPGLGGGLGVPGDPGQQGLASGEYPGTFGTKVLVRLLALLALVDLLYRVELGVDQGLLVAEEGIAEAFDVRLVHRAAAAVVAPGGVQFVDVAGQALAQLLYIREDPPVRDPGQGAKVHRQDSADVPQWLGPVIATVAAGLRAESVPARPGPACSNCPVASSCPADPAGQEVRP